MNQAAASWITCVLCTVGSQMPVGTVCCSSLTDCLHKHMHVAGRFSKTYVNFCFIEEISCFRSISKYRSISKWTLWCKIGVKCLIFRSFHHYRPIQLTYFTAQNCLFSYFKVKVSRSTEVCFCRKGPVKKTVRELAAERCPRYNVDISKLKYLAHSPVCYK